MTVVARFTWDTGPLMQQVETTLEQRMNVAAGVLAADVKKKIRKGGGRPHVPSKPGEPPRRDTGILISNVYHSGEPAGIPVSNVNGVISTYVSVDAPQARALELGYAPGNLEPRPYLRPTLAESGSKIMRIIGGVRRNG